MTESQNYEFETQAHMWSDKHMETCRQQLLEEQAELQKIRSKTVFHEEPFFLDPFKLHIRGNYKGYVHNLTIPFARLDNPETAEVIREKERMRICRWILWKINQAKH